jgi:hypothetical protein
MVFPDEEGPYSLERSTLIIRILPFSVIVRTVGNTPFFIERIELLQPDADERLGRYKLVEKSPGQLQAEPAELPGGC